MLPPDGGFALAAVEGRHDPGNGSDAPGSSLGRQTSALPKWLISVVAEAVIVTVVSAALNALQVVRLTPYDFLVIGLGVSLATLAYFMVCLLRENRGLRSRIGELNTRIDRMMAEPAGFTQVEDREATLDSTAKEVIVSHWWPKGTTVQFVIWSTDTTHASVAFESAEVAPPQLPTDHSHAVVKWSEPRTPKWGKTFETDEAGIWHFIAAWPRGNWWGSKVGIRVFESLPFPIVDI